MILVLFLLFLILLNLFSYIKIKVKKINISNISDYKYDFIIKCGLYLFNKVKIFEIKIDKEKFLKSRTINKLKKNIKFELEKMPKFREIEKIEINLEEINLKVKLGTEDVILTSVLVLLISATTGIILGKFVKKYEKEKYKYTIQPFYNNRNLFELQLNCIINAKMVNIIYVIYIFLKKRSENKHERTSDRRTYDYSYE